MEDNKIIDVSKILIVPSDTEIPVHDNSVLTKRPLCADFPENSLILDKTEAIKVITDISEDLEESKDTCINNIPQYIEDLQAVFNPLNVEECTSDLFKDKEYTLIDNVDDLKKYLSELLMRFDTSPGNYTKGDYLFLLSLLYKSLIHLYETSTASVIVKEWLNPHRDDLVPSEKLVKTSLDLISENLLSKEDKSNKLTSFQVIPDDIHYPSEKLVKDNLNELLGLIAICL